MWGILDLLIEAAYTRYKLPLLEQSNLRLQKLRFLARVCKDRQCLSLSAAHRNCLASLARGKLLFYADCVLRAVRGFRQAPLDVCGRVAMSPLPLGEG